MPCINNPLPYLVAYDPTNPQLHMVSSSVATLLKRSDVKYWYCQISCKNSFVCFDIEKLIPQEIMKDIVMGDVYIVVDNGLEPFLSVADSIYENLVVKAGIPAKKIILLSSVPTMIDHVKTLSKKFSADEILVEWFSMFEWNLIDYITNRQIKPLDTLQKKKYPKKFINFNRRWRLHRPLMMTLLHDKKLIDSGFISFGQSDFHNDTWDQKWKELQWYYKDSPEILEILNRNESVKTLPSMYLDTEDLITNRAEQTDSTDQYYLDSYFSVINETTYHTKPGYDGVVFFSEKIFKAVAMKHPFIVATAPNSLEYFRKLGYKTFHPYINESYDLEMDDGKRMIMIVDEIDRLCKLEGAEFKEFLKQLKMICNHNYHNMINKSVFTYPMN